MVHSLGTFRTLLNSPSNSQIRPKILGPFSKPLSRTIANSLLDLTGFVCEILRSIGRTDPSVLELRIVPSEILVSQLTSLVWLPSQLKALWHLALLQIP